VRLRKAEIETKLVRSPFGAVRPPKKTLEEFSREWTAARRADGGISPKTRYEEDRLLARHVLPEFASYQLGRISPGDVEKFLARVASDSPWIARAVRILLRKMMADARRLRYVAENPIADTHPISPKGREHIVWDEEQVRLFLAEAKRSSRFYPLYLTALLTGMRQGELLGLRRQDLDLTLAVAHVNRSLLRVGKEVLFKEPKTKASRRAVSLAPVLAEELRRVLDGHRFELVFCQEDGKPLHGHNIVQRDFRAVMELRALRNDLRRKGRAEASLPKPLPRIRFHDLRHAHATYLALAGVPLKVAQERLGHTTSAMTLQVYTHVLGGQQEAAARAVEDRILGRLRPRYEEENAPPMLPRTPNKGPGLA